VNEKSKINIILKKSIKTGFFSAIGVFLIYIYLNYTDNPTNFRIQDNYKALIFFIIMPLGLFTLEYLSWWFAKRKKNK